MSAAYGHEMEIVDICGAVEIRRPYGRGHYSLIFQCNKDGHESGVVLRLGIGSMGRETRIHPELASRLMAMKAIFQALLDLVDEDITRLGEKWRDEVKDREERKQ